MIPQAFITEWSQQVPWQTNEQVEQDLIISRALVEIFSDDWLASRLAFRGGTALHKLFLNPQPRYSEDIDLVQINAGPIKEILWRIQERLGFLGEAEIELKKINSVLKYKVESETPPVQILRLKIEINCREHFTELGYQIFPYQMNSSWFSGACNIKTYKMEELLGTKLRALYQRKKGRDLFDMHRALVQMPELDREAILTCFRRYMEFSVGQSPTLKMYLQNLQEKMGDEAFIGDISGLIRPEERYDQTLAYELVRSELLEKMDLARGK